MSEHVKVLFFATLRDITGVKEAMIEFPPGARIADIKRLVIEKFPALAQNMGTNIVAMNHEYAADEQIVEDEAEIAIFPPVSGGSQAGKEPPTLVEIVDHKIDVDAVIEQVTLPTTGGACIFTGTVRAVTRRGAAHDTEHLEYEAYRDMAEIKMRQICTEIRSRWSEVEGIAIIQRIGTLMPGEVSVAVACSASHRDMGIFEAAHYGIDRLKEIVPIWKKEVSKDGEEWVEGEYYPQQGD